MKPLYYFCCFVLLITVGACNRTDDDDNNNNQLPDGSFTFVMNGVQWQASPDMVGAVEVTFGSLPKISITATRGSDSSYVNLQIPNFSGSDTTAAVTGTGQTVVVFFSDSSYSLVNGSLYIQRTINGNQVKYSGTFTGEFEEIVNSYQYPVSGGSYEAYRLL